MKYVIEKAGEGSRGGHVVGHYASGKPRYQGGAGATAGSYQRELLVAEKKRREAKASTPKKEPAMSAQAERAVSDMPRRQRYADIKSEVIDDLYDQVKKGLFSPPAAHYNAPSLPGGGQADRMDDHQVKNPGSRGGKFIGYSRTGKPVYQTASTSANKYKKFTAEDHHDAAALHAAASPVDVDKIRSHMLRAGKEYTGRKDLLSHKAKHKLETKKREEKSMSVEEMLDDIIKAGEGEGPRGGNVIGHKVVESWASAGRGMAAKVKKKSEIDELYDLVRAI